MAGFENGDQLATPGFESPEHCSICPQVYFGNARRETSHPGEMMNQIPMTCHDFPKHLNNHLKGDPDERVELRVKIFYQTHLARFPGDRKGRRHRGPAAVAHLVNGTDHETGTDDSQAV